MTIDTQIPSPGPKQLLLHLLVGSVLFSYQTILNNPILKDYIISVIEFRNTLEGWKSKNIIIDYNSGLLIDTSNLNIEEYNNSTIMDNKSISPAFIKSILMPYILESPNLPTIIEKDVKDYGERLNTPLIISDYSIAFSVPGQLYPESIISDTIRQSIPDNKSSQNGDDKSDNYSGSNSSANNSGINDDDEEEDEDSIINIMQIINFRYQLEELH